VNGWVEKFFLVCVLLARQKQSNIRAKGARAYIERERPSKIDLETPHSVLSHKRALQKKKKKLKTNEKKRIYITCSFPCPKQNLKTKKKKKKKKVS
jgi:hypothetical protein